MSVARALGREDWLKAIAPLTSINPLTMPRSAQPRRRVRRYFFLPLTIDGATSETM